MNEIMPIEIELKLRINDIGSIKAKLDNIGCVWDSTAEQSDKIYYMPRLDNELFWRIREEGEKAVLSVKRLLNDESAVELETNISDPKSVRMMLEISGFEEFAIVKKRRMEGSLKGFKICLDEVDKLGCFIEIEKITDKEKQRVVIEEQIKEFAKLLGLSTSDICNERYHTMLNETKKVT